MSNVVYLISSLPSLTFGQQPPISLDDFHSEAEEQLSINNFRKLRDLDLKHIIDTETGVLKEFVEVSEQLHDDIQKIRNSKTNGGTPDITILSKAILDQNPLQREKSIMEWQWEQLSNIDWGETFTFTEVLVYKLKLQIIHRLHSFKSLKGIKIIESIVEQQKKEEQ